jgi:hypothetical protein
MDILKPVRFFILYTVIFGFSFSSASGAELSLTSFVREVKQALLLVERSAVQKSLPRLKEVKISIKSAQAKKVDGEIGFYVVSVGAEGSDSKSSTIELVLVPPPADSPSDVSQVSIATQLAQSIEAAGLAINEAGKGEPPLIAKKLTATLIFAVMSNQSGGFEIGFPPFSASASAEISASNTHTIEVTYEE